MLFGLDQARAPAAKAGFGLTGRPDVQKEAGYEKIVDAVAEDVLKKYRLKKAQLPFLVCTMIEIPRAALLADRMAEVADFFSFGTNDLTQMTFGYSRDDVGSFLPGYVERGILETAPFQSLDQTGVGQLVALLLEPQPDQPQVLLELGALALEAGDGGARFRHLHQAYHPLLHPRAARSSHTPSRTMVHDEIGSSSAASTRCLNASAQTARSTTPCA